jgi:GTP cyclohydrolase IIa
LTIQLTLVRIEEYGSWTLSLGSDRETQLQMFQAKLYYDLQRLFAAKECIVYSNRFDEYFVITNGLSLADHLAIRDELSTLYRSFRLSMAIGIGVTPYQANLDAYEVRKKRNSISNQPEIYETAKLRRSSHDSISRDDLSVQLMHIDMNDSSDMCSRLSPYEITSIVVKIYSRLSEEFLKKESLTFFLGGDNYMVVSSGVTKRDVKETLEKVTKDIGINLKCGIGTGKTGRKAALAATKALDTIRDLRHEGRLLPVYELKCL